MKEEMGKTKEEKMKTKFYQNLENVKCGTARKTWEVKSCVLDVARNYPGHRKYEHSNWRCQAYNQKVKEDQEHLTLHIYVKGIRS